LVNHVVWLGEMVHCKDPWQLHEHVKHGAVDICDSEYVVLLLLFEAGNGGLAGVCCGGCCCCCCCCGDGLGKVVK